MQSSKCKQQKHPFCPALHADPGSLVPPPGCQARSQLRPQPGSPSEPGYPHLSTPPESSPIAPGARRPHPWGYNAISRPHNIAVFRDSLRGRRGPEGSARLSGMSRSSRRSGPCSPTRVAALDHLPTAHLKPCPSSLGLPKRHMYPFRRAPRAEPEHPKRTPLCQVKTRQSLAPCS